MRRLSLFLVLAALIAAAASTPGSAASFNDSAPCPASGPLLVCPTMHVGQPVQLQLLAHDGCDAYRWEIVNGGLPAGLSMSSGGLVSGTPTKAETTEPWVWVHDLTAAEGGPSWCGGDNHSERQFVFTVEGGGGAPSPAPAPAPPPQPALQITTSSIPRATAGTSYTATLTASGASSVTWTVSSGSLPAGVTLGSNGALIGTPAGAGTYTFTVRVDAGGRSASKQLQLVVAAKLTAVAPAAQTWEVGRPLQVAIDAKGGTPGYSWKLSGTLPARTGFVGNKGNGSTSYLQGVPAEAGTFPIVLTVTDSAGVSTDVTVTLTVAPKLQINTFRVGTARVRKSYRLVLASVGGVGAMQWAVGAGSLPAGLKLDPKTGAVSGKARRAGRFRFTLVVTDSLGARAAMTYTLRVRR
ncbi:MAG TPA: Ig domain-containing protein [Gaiellaceae bacterium]|nr:Ig domain-containing protein [Gaiellaceae bacterium]